MKLKLKLMEAVGGLIESIVDAIGLVNVILILIVSAMLIAVFIPAIMRLQ